MKSSPRKKSKYLRSSLDLYDGNDDKINEDKFQDIVAQATVLAERAEKRIRKMQVGLSVVQHDLSPLSNKRTNARRKSRRRQFY